MAKANKRASRQNEKMKYAFALHDSSMYRINRAQLYADLTRFATDHPSVRGRSGKPQLAERAGNVEIRLRRLRGLPRQISSRFFLAFDSIKIDPPDRGRIKLRQSETSWELPARRSRVWISHPATERCKPLFKSAQPAGKNVEIDPHSIRTDFKFPVEMLPRRIGLQKCFRHIAVPQMIAPSIGVGVIEREELTIAALESQIQMFAATTKPAPRFPVSGSGFFPCQSE